MDNFLFEMASAIAELLGTFAKALSPLIIGLIIAYLLNPAVSWFEERIKSRGFSIFITYGLVSAGLFGLFYADFYRLWHPFVGGRDLSDYSAAVL